MSDVLLEVIDLKKYFAESRGLLGKTSEVVRAVDGVSFRIRRGETLGLVGESGCGKTTVGRSILRLVEPTAGEILYEQQNILELEGKELKTLRRKMQIVFQDPSGSLDPRMNLLDTVGLPLKIHKLAEGIEIKEKVLKVINLVGLDSGQLLRYPHEFSGGQRQRIAIARALVLDPTFIVLDEPTSALDVSVQAQILNLLKDLQRKFQLTYVFITHNLSVVKHVSNRTAVMYLGKIVECGGTEEIFQKPLHPYTQALVSANPIPNPKVKAKRIILSGEIPSSINPPSGCRFHPRCPSAHPQCQNSIPELIDVEDGHLVACPFIEK